MSEAAADIRLKAMDLLARREHSRLELVDKLRRHFGDSPELVEQTVERLAREGLQSDERYAEALVSTRERQGKGPLRIAQELRQKGVADEIVGGVLDENDARWWELAREARDKRFGSAPVSGNRERARQMRFLQYRGFSPEQTREAIASAPTHP